MTELLPQWGDAAGSPVLKGAHFVAAVAFMFASTNVVIELGTLILLVP